MKAWAIRGNIKTQTGSIPSWFRFRNGSEMRRIGGDIDPWNDWTARPGDALLFARREDAAEVLRVVLGTAAYLLEEVDIP